MKAIVHDKYGSFDLLELRDIDKPAIKDDEVLVRVEAAGLHIGDCFGVRGAPFVMRIASGLLKPKQGVPGFDLAGHVEAVGRQVKRFQVGDAVFGASTGTCAEYARAAEDQLALKPATLTFEEAAALPTSALAAYIEFRIGDNQDELGIIDRTYAPKAMQPGPGGAILLWHVDDIEAAFERLKAMGAKAYEPITKRGDSGFVTASVVDPFGNILGIMNNPHYVEILAAQKK